MTVSVPRIEKLLAEATARPWMNVCGVIAGPEVDLFTCPYEAVDQPRRKKLEQDAELVVATVNALPELIAAVKALEFHEHSEAADHVIFLPVPGCPLCEALAPFSFEEQA